MDCSPSPLLPRFAAARAAGEPLVLATLVATRGSTYRKPGAQMLLAADGSWTGLLSGGCLEADLAKRAGVVFETGRPTLVRYENSGEDDALWGLGSGCEGAMDIWLTPLDAARHWQPLVRLEQGLAARDPLAWAAVLASDAAGLAAGDFVALPLQHDLAADVADWIAAQLSGVRGDAALIVKLASPNIELFVARLVLPPQLLVLGGGLDAQPLVELAGLLGWRATVVDHRPAYAEASRFPQAARVLCCRPDELPRHVALSGYAAAVVMSHHLQSDLGWLRTMADAGLPYVGLLGPAGRRAHLLSELGEAATRLEPRLHAPVGLDLGGRDPQSIALAIVAEIQAHLHGRSARTVDWTRA